MKLSEFLDERTTVPRWFLYWLYAHMFMQGILATIRLLERFV
jgi:hypothetical protein